MLYNRWIVFKYAKKLQDKDWWRFFDISDCGGILKLTKEEPLMTMSSPNFPGKYYNDLHCYWLIKVHFTYLLNYLLTYLHTYLHMYLLSHSLTHIFT